MLLKIYFLEKLDLSSPMRVLLLCGASIAWFITFVNSYSPHQYIRKNDEAW